LVHAVADQFRAPPSLSMTKENHER